MNQLLNNLPVNWTDGMKLNKSHFIQMENAITERINDSTGLMIKDYEFGLLPSHDKNQLSLDLDVFDGKIVLTTCRAITLNGTRIEIVNLDVPELNVSIDAISNNLVKEEGGSYLIILNVNPFVSQPIGIPDNEEIPPRQPNIIPKYSISIIAAQQVNTQEFTSFNLPIGKLTYQSGVFKRDLTYLPPCNRIDADKTLSNRFEALGKILGELESNALEVYKRSLNEQKRGKINYLADSANAFAEHVLNFLTNYSSQLHLFFKQESPKLLLDFFIRLAKVIKISWSKLRDEDREEMLNYFERHAGYTPKKLREEYENIIQLTYNHIDIHPILKSIEEFLEIYNSLFVTLVELKFISKKIEGIVRGEQKKEEKAKQEEKPKKTGGGMFRK